MTLYLKYRPQKISDLDSESVRNTLLKILKSGNVPHAFLFCGPRGTGKTSTARILAKALNCEKLDKSSGSKVVDVEPCNECDQCRSITRGENLDVIELDAASNRGIDDIRSLRESIKLSPTKGHKKVYIIDEAHMLTTEASNAFLKTLEEPPDHVIFILATTNPEKLIPTIRSRVANIVFKKASKSETFSVLQKVAKGEKLKVEEGTLLLIEKYAEGSFRDAVKIFEQLQNEGVIEDPESASAFIEGKISFDTDQVVDLLVERNIKALIDIVERAVENGNSIKHLTRGILDKLHEKLLISVGVAEGEKINLTDDDLIALIGFVSRASQEINPLIEQLPLEVAIVEWGQGSRNSEVNVKIKKTESDVIYNTKVGKSTLSAKSDQKNKTQENVSNDSEQDRKVKLEVNSESLSDDVWSDILRTIRPINTSTEALLRAARPVSINNETLILGVYYKFHKERLEERPHKEILYEVVGNVLGRPVKVICQLTNPPSNAFSENSKEQVVYKKVDSMVNGVLTEANDEDIVKVAEDIFGK